VIRRGVQAIYKRGAFVIPKLGTVVVPKLRSVPIGTCATDDGPARRNPIPTSIHHEHNFFPGHWSRLPILEGTAPIPYEES